VSAVLVLPPEEKDNDRGGDRACGPWRPEAIGGLSSSQWMAGRMGRTDEELVEACQAGESSAFDLLMARWEDKIRGAAYRFLGSEDEARDVAQETFLKAYRALPGFKQEARFSSWLYQIAVNLSRDRLRRRKGRAHLSLEALEEAGAVVAARAPEGLDLVLQLDLRRAVRRAIGALSEEQREVVILKEYQGLTFLEIAQTLGLPISTVKTRLYRGLGQLRLHLEGAGVGGTAPVASPRAARAQ
jgi:RNA polymerase sigma-70 factor (ECF subfamily)